MKFRRVPDAHLNAYLRILQYAFEPEVGPELDDDSHEWPDTFHRRGLYRESSAARSTTDGDLAAADLVATCGYYDFAARVRGRWHRLAGVQAVASSPGTRRRGHVARMLEDLLAELHGEGIHFSALYPFEDSFYRRLGWARTARYARTTVPPEGLASVAADPAGRFRRLRPDDYDEMDEVLRSVSDHSLAIRRTEGEWRHRTFTGWHTDPHVYGWEDDEGALRGYLVYRIEDGADGNTLSVSEFVARDHEARTQLYRFLRNHDSQVQTVTFTTPIQTDLLDTLANPREATVELRAGGMVRLVSVADAFSALGYPSDVEATVALEVEDGQCDWNDGTFSLSVADGQGTCERRDVDPDVSLDVGSLSRMTVGALASSDLERYDDLVAADQDAVATLDALFPRTNPYLREFF